MFRYETDKEILKRLINFSKSENLLPRRDTKSHFKLTLLLFCNVDLYLKP